MCGSSETCQGWSRILLQIGLLIELQRIHKDRCHDDVCQLAGFTNQRQVSRMPGPRRRRVQDETEYEEGEIRRLASDVIGQRRPAEAAESVEDGHEAHDAGGLGGDQIVHIPAGEVGDLAAPGEAGC